jgi:23S rRNA (uracil1939-C5)-methyltransferase
MEQHKTIRGPLTLGSIHSSGRSMGVAGNKNVYLDWGIPGETVTYTLERRKQGFHSGKTENILDASPYRTIPFCGHYASCGGCSWQHIAYPHQLELKLQILKNALDKYGINYPSLPPVIGSPKTLYYRHRMEYSFASAAFRENSENGPRKPGLGFHPAGEPGKVNAIRTCYLQSDPCRDICNFIEKTALDKGMEFYDQETRSGFLRSLSLRVNSAGEVLMVLGMGHDNPNQRDALLNMVRQAFPQIVSLNYTIHISSEHSQLQGEIIPFGGTTSYLWETVGGIKFRIHASSFFQPNVNQAENIFTMARDWANLKGNEKIYDLYTGVGTLALFLSGRAGHVTGIEGSSLAIEDATENAIVNDIQNAGFICGDILETFKPPFLSLYGKPDLIVLDPPRSGTLIEIKKTINASGAKNIIYLSCNPVSLAFDLRQLCEVYRICLIQPFDMLPQTHHLETLVLLEKHS